MGIKNAEKQVVSKRRVAEHGEVYTAQREVNAMLDLVKQETERIESRFLEPACGNGNFLAEVLQRKLTVAQARYAKNLTEYDRYAVLAISSIYGIDILEDNVKECRARLFNIFQNFYQYIYKTDCSADCARTVNFILSKNIVWGDALTLKRVDNPELFIVFSEWSPVNGSMIKRRDFKFEHLTQCSTEGLPLFSDLGDKAFIPSPIKEYPVTNYLRLADESNN